MKVARSLKNRSFFPGETLLMFTPKLLSDSVRHCLKIPTMIQELLPILHLSIHHKTMRRPITLSFLAFHSTFLIVLLEALAKSKPIGLWLFHFVRNGKEASAKSKPIGLSALPLSPNVLWGGDRKGGNRIIGSSIEFNILWNRKEADRIIPSSIESRCFVRRRRKGRWWDYRLLRSIESKVLWNRKEADRIIASSIECIDWEWLLGMGVHWVGLVGHVGRSETTVDQISALPLIVWQRARERSRIKGW